ncbi:MAG: hypothetical protein KKF00_10535 [Proteobacteria bacterium]|nr:hypothetical protein [Pseudomonadota bacterium]
MNKIIVKPFLIRKKNILYKKDLYGSDEVANFIQSFDREDSEGQKTNQVLKKLDYLARRGFDVDGSNIKYYKEYDVYRIRVKGDKQDGRIMVVSQFEIISSCNA